MPTNQPLPVTDDRIQNACFSNPVTINWLTPILSNSTHSHVYNGMPIACLWIILRCDWSTRNRRFSGALSMRQSSHSQHRLCAFNTRRGVRLWTQLEQLDCVLDMTCKYLYLHLCFQTRIILLVCTLVCSHNIGLPMYLSGILASLLASSLTLATCYFCCVVSYWCKLYMYLHVFVHTRIILLAYILVCMACYISPVVYSLCLHLSCF